MPPVFIAITEAAALTAIALSIAWIITRKIVRAEFEDTSCDDTYLLRFWEIGAASGNSRGGGDIIASSSGTQTNGSHSHDGSEL